MRSPLRPLRPLRRVAPCWLGIGSLLTLLTLGVVGCGLASGSSSLPPLPPMGYRLTRCSGQAVPTTTSAPRVAPPTVYGGAIRRMGGTPQDGAHLYAFSAQDGTLRWCDSFAITGTFPCPGSCPPPPLAIVGQPLLAANVLYVCVSGYGGFTYAFNASDGALRWKRNTGCGIYSLGAAYYALPLLANGALYSGSDALDPVDGAIRWKLPFDALAGAVVGDTIYAYSEQALYALVAGSGAVRWHAPLTTSVGALPIVAGGTVYAGDTSGALVSGPPNLPCAFAFDASSGKLLWSSLHGIVSGLSMDQAADLVYFGTQGPVGSLYALEGTTGVLRWQHRFGPSAVTTPILASDTLYFGADGIYALSALDGKVLWHVQLGASLSTAFTPVTLLNGTLYVGQTDGEGNTTLYALSTADGSVLWHVSGINQISPPVAG